MTAQGALFSGKDAGGISEAPLAIQIADLLMWVSAMKRPRSNIARNRATKDRFAGIRTRIVSQLLEKLLCVELPH